MTRILDGKQIAKSIKDATAEKISSLVDPPRLAIVLATDNESTFAYVNMLKKSAEKTGIEAEVVDLGANASDDMFRKRSNNWQLMKPCTGSSCRLPWLPASISTPHAH